MPSSDPLQTILCDGLSWKEDSSRGLRLYWIVAGQRMSAELVSIVLSGQGDANAPPEIAGFAIVKLGASAEMYPGSDVAPATFEDFSIDPSSVSREDGPCRRRIDGSKQYCIARVAD